VRLRGLALAVGSVLLVALAVVPPDASTRFFVTAGPAPNDSRAFRAREVPEPGTPSSPAPATVVEGRPPKNVRVTKDGSPGSYRRVDGTIDSTMERCGTGRREQNEPSVAVDPRNPRIIVIGANDYCAAITTGDSWLGFYRSANGGRTWRNSLVPGYPTDTSAAGRASPAFESCSVASDPTLSFDLTGRLFFGFICFNRGSREGHEAHEPEEEARAEGLVGSSTFVAMYDQDGSHYVRTTLVSRGTPDRNEDKINLTVDQTRGPFAGSVYASWVQLANPSDEGFPRDPMLVAHSSNHGATFSRPIPISPLVHARFPDLSVGPDGAVYAAFRSSDTLWVVKSTNGGRSFASPVQVAASLVPFDSGQFSEGSGDDCGTGRYRCHSRLIFSRFDTQIAVVADSTGVHVLWNERVGGGQSKMMTRTSQNGVAWSPARQIDQIAAGHQYFPDLASAGGVITAVFYDSRNDPAYAPTLPPGTTKSKKSSGGAVDVYAAQSSNGGLTWIERRITNRSSNFNYLTPANLPFWGDYIYVSAVGEEVQVGWTDSRDFVAEKKESFAAYRPCDGRPYVDDSCLSRGGSDENIYSARL
jgi:hypothetical protein